MSVLTRIDVAPTPDDRERQRPQDRGVEEAADHEDEEQRLAEHEDRGEDEDPDEEHVDPHAVLDVLPRRRQPGEQDVDPGRAATAAIARVVSLPGRVRRSRSRSAEDRREREQDVPAPSRPSRRRTAPRLGFVAALMPERYSTPGRRERRARPDASLPSEQPDRQRPDHDRQRRAIPSERRQPAARSPATRPGGPGRRAA